MHLTHELKSGASRVDDPGMTQVAMRGAWVTGVLIMSSLAATVSPATAAAGSAMTQDQPRSTWVQPGTDPLDGLGVFVYVDAPAPGPTQASLLGYEYTLQFRFEDRSFGVLALGYKNGQKVAGFGLIPSHLVDTVRFDWAFGRLYYLFTYRIGPDLWASWVYDWSKGSWTFIAVQHGPAGMGRMLPTSTTGVDYDATLAPSPAADTTTCAFYPRVDAYLSAPTGWRGSVVTLGTLAGSSVEEGDCDSVTTAIPGSQRYVLGATA